MDWTTAWPSESASGNSRISSEIDEFTPSRPSELEVMWCFATTESLGIAIDYQELLCRQFRVCRQGKLESLDQVGFRLGIIYLNVNLPLRSRMWAWATHEHLGTERHGVPVAVPLEKFLVSK